MRVPYRLVATRQEHFLPACGSAQRLQADLHVVLLMAGNNLKLVISPAFML